ncbi:MAG: hypothetical protein JWM80_6344, partial [Cyanobacteria bacterium RYN_339]|nr:hypothetical protein [Cyanobacteria bacterium RYN_339]
PPLLAPPPLPGVASVQLTPAQQQQASFLQQQITQIQQQIQALINGQRA